MMLIVAKYEMLLFLVLANSREAVEEAATDMAVKVPAHPDAGSWTMSVQRAPLWRPGIDGKDKNNSL